MNHPIRFTGHSAGRAWRRDLQFAVGVVVAIGGAAVLLSEVVRSFT